MAHLPRVARPAFARPQRPLSLMAKPPADVRDRIRHWPRTQRSRPADLLHISLLGLFDLADAPNALPDLLEAMRDFRADPFRVVFDRLLERSCVTLRPGETLQGARRFHATLTVHLLARNFPFFGKPPSPHLTIHYGRDGRGDERIEPISWRVEEIVLIESVYGETRHIEHGRWRLHVPERAAAA